MRDRAIGPLRVLAPEFQQFFTLIDEVTRLLRMACAANAPNTEPVEGGKPAAFAKS